MSIKLNITKKVETRKKTKSKHIRHYSYFYRIFFLILFLLEKIPKIKFTYGKQDYQPDAKIRTEKRLKMDKKW